MGKGAVGPMLKSELPNMLIPDMCRSAIPVLNICRRMERCVFLGTAPNPVRRLGLVASRGAPAATPRPEIANW